MSMTVRRIVYDTAREKRLPIIRRLWVEEGVRDFDELARQVGVSSATVRVDVRQLGLLDDPAERRAEAIALRERDRRNTVPDERDLTSYWQGDPLPGRSALDQKRGKA